MSLLWSKKLQVLDEVRVAIKFAAVLQAFGPGEDAGDGVGAGGPPLEVKVRMRSQCWHVITIETNNTPFSTVLEEFVSTCYSPFSPQDGSRISQTALFPRVPVLFFFFFFQHLIWADVKTKCTTGVMAQWRHWPSGVHGNVWSRCRGRPRPRWSFRPDTPGPMSSDPENQILSEDTWTTGQQRPMSTSMLSKMWPEGSLLHLDTLCVARNFVDFSLGIEVNICIYSLWHFFKIYLFIFYPTLLIANATF